MKKKVLALILSSVMALSLFGCGNSDQPATEEVPAEEATESTDDTDAATEEAPEAEAESTDDAAEAEAQETTGDAALKIAIVSSPSGVDDGSFNEDNYNGILTFIESHPDCTVTPVQETTGDVTAAVQAVADIVADYDVIVCCG